MNYEKKRLAGMNIIICTPGRLLQHMDENELFSTEQLQMLVIDEADRILDMGFRKQVARSEATNVTKKQSGSRWTQSWKTCPPTARRCSFPPHKHVALKISFASRSKILSSYPRTSTQNKRRLTNWRRYSLAKTYTSRSTNFAYRATSFAKRNTRSTSCGRS